MSHSQVDQDIFVHDRFCAEIDRLQLGVGELAEVLGVTAKTVSRWRSGLTPIPSDKLVVMFGHGFDVLFMLTGQRQLDFGSSTDVEEQNLIANFRALDALQRQALLSLLEAFGTRK